MRYWSTALLISLLSAAVVGWHLNDESQEELELSLQSASKRHSLALQALTLDSKSFGSLGFLGVSSLTAKQIAQGDLPAYTPSMLEILEYLAHYCNADGAFLVDITGTLQTSWDVSGKSSTGSDVRHRPYFQIAMQGKPNIYAAIGMNTGRRTLYMAAPIFKDNSTSSEAVGAAVLRLGLDHIDALLGSWPETALLLTPTGVVFSSSKPEWLFSLKKEITESELKVLVSSKQFGNSVNAAAPKLLPFELNTGFNRINGKQHAVSCSSLNWNDPLGPWTLVLLKEAKDWHSSPGILLFAGLTGAGCLLVFFALHLFLRNLEQRREADMNIRQSQAEMLQIFNTAASGMRIVDTRNIVLKVNTAFVELSGFSREELEGKVCHDVCRGQLCETENCNLKRVLGGEKHIEGIVMISRKDGMPVYCELTAMPFTTLDGRFLGVIEDFRDITERLNAQNAIRKSESKYRELVESARSIILKLDLDGNITFFNEYAQSFYGYTEEEILGKPIYETIAPELSDTDFPVFLQKISEDPESYELTENENVCKDGRKVWISWTNRVLRDDVFEEVNGLLCIGLDATERKKTQDCLHEAMEVISSSIRYASRIQRAILPASADLGGFLTKSFALWEPRDMVGGDIYWVKQLPAGMLVILADCTGHGVPGAFMTLISSGALDRALSKFEPDDPAGLIAKMNQYVKLVLGQDMLLKGENLSDDGLELGVCYIEESLKKLTFAGAHFSLFMVNGEDVVVFKGDRRGIGYRAQTFDAKFTNYTVELEPGLRFYMSTDGLFDQVGEQTRRSFGKNRFIELLLSLRDVPINDHGEIIYSSLIAYQGSQSRRDDVSIMGFEI